MISSLHIKNIGIIDDINIEFEDGLNVITGETGAGKSLIIDSLSILCGLRFSKDFIRKGEEFALVEASFFDKGEEFVVSRKIFESGKNICKINGELCTVSQIKECLSSSIDFNEQGENFNLMNKSKYIEFLDLFSKDEIKCVKEKYDELYTKYIDIKKELSKNYGNDIEKERTLSLLKYQLNEIQNADLKIDEDVELENKRKIAANSEKIFNSLNLSSTIISDKIIQDLDEAIKALNKINNLDIRYQNEYSKIQDAYYNLQDVSSNLYDFSNEIELNISDFSSIEQRLNLIYDLKRKYGSSIEEILNYKNQVESKISEIENLEQYILDLKQKQNEITKEMFKLASNMNEIRNKSAKILSENITKKFKLLEMFNANLNIKVTMNQSKDFNKNGLDEVEFLIATNLGSDYKPLEKIASGGEISRIMLAIRAVINEFDFNNKIIIFDEIDTGISGKAIVAVSDNIKSISKTSQVICVTHHANVAAKANANFFVFKENIDGKTVSKVRKLNKEDLVKELARITSGNNDTNSINYAKSLISNENIA